MPDDRGLFPPGWTDSKVARTTASANQRIEARLATGKAKPMRRPKDKDSDAEPRRWRRLRECVSMLLEANCGIRVPAEKRTHRRFPFRKPLTITPISDRSGRPESSQSFAAFGTDISSIGIGFLARQLVPSQKAILTCTGASDSSVSLLFEPRWVRFTRDGWYQIGGRLVDVLEETTAPSPDIQLLEEPPDIAVF